MIQAGAAEMEGVKTTDGLDGVLFADPRRIRLFQIGI